MRNTNQGIPAQGTLKEWLDLDLEGQLAERERRELAKAVDGSAELRRERQELLGLGQLLTQSRIEVRPGFVGQVMKSLPASGWEARSPKGWQLVAALLVLLGGASAALLGTGSARLAPQSAFLGAAVAVADLFKAAALTGAGMLHASWRGLGLAMGEALRGSWLGWVAAGLLVLGLNGLLFMQLRARRRTVAVTGRSDQEEPR